MAKQVKVTIASDQAYRSIYWALSSSQLKMAAQNALALFRETFPEVEFTLSSEIGLWESKDLPVMRDFPMSLLFDLPRHSSFAKVVETIGKRAADLGFHEKSRIRDERALQRIVENTKKSSKPGRFWYLMGFLDSVFAEEMLRDLTQRISHDDREFVLGFTGKFFVLERDLGGCLGIALKGGHYAVFPIQYKQRLSSVILHEVGHLFGADHPEDKDVASIMSNRYARYTTQFDQENTACIRAKIATL